VAIHDDRDALEALLGDLRRWTADARATDAAAARSRQRWLRHQAEEEATFAGLALDLAERERSVVLRTTSGRTHSGRLVAVGRDFCVLRAEKTRVTTFVASAAIASLRAQPGTSVGPRFEGAGARPVPLAATLAGVLADLAGERPLVRIGVLGELEALTGELRAVGADVATVRVASEPPATVYVRLGSVSELSVLGSG
jgi:hypothetical protein